MRVNIKRFVAIGSVALAALAIMVGAATADTYATGLEPPTFTLGSVDGQDGWHSAVPGDIPALPNGYDQEVVNNGTYGGQTPPSTFGAQSLRVSNAYSDPTAEFEFQTYSKSTTDNAGETLANTVFDGTFSFISTSANLQPGLMVSVSPDDGHGGRMSYVGLTDTTNGIDITFYDTNADGTFRAHDVGTYSRNQVHTIEFLIQFVPGAANDVLRLFVDKVDIGDRDGVCFTTWENYYRAAPPVGEGRTLPPVTNSFEFRTSNGWDCSANGATQDAAGTCVVSGLLGGGYLFDNVTTTTASSGGPAPTTCGSATLNVTKFYDANANGTKDAGESDISGWKVAVSNGVDPDLVGTTPFTADTLAPGDWTASEFSPIQTNWYATTPTSVEKTLAAGDDVSVSFGNVCTGAGGGLTIGFWTNKNGQALVGSNDLAMLQGLNLRNANGTDFNPTSYSQLKSWLSKATATNMAYMLSAQLAAMELNVFNGKVAGSALVYAPGTQSANPAGFATVDALMTEANKELGSHGSTPSGSPYRSYQETLKNALDRANNSTSFAQKTPCSFSFAP